jgi:hypothetical protein
MIYARGNGVRKLVIPAQAGIQLLAPRFHGSDEKKLRFNRDRL